MADPTDPGLGMADPTQQGAPTWGTMAVPDQMAFFNPGAMLIGQAAMDQAYNAKRAQNLAAFDAFQRDNPQATASDLTAAYEKLTGGENYFGQNVGGTWGNLAGIFGRGSTAAPGAGPGGAAPGGGVGTPGGGAVPSMMQTLADKNQRVYQAAQARQQGDINKSFTDALEQSTSTANTKEEWLAGAKSLLPPSLQGGFDQWMAGQNTDQMFQVYQQHRVTPIVASGVEHLWTDENSYVIAAGGNKALGHMAYLLAKDQVAGKVAANQADLAYKKGQTTNELAAAGEHRAQTGYIQEETTHEKVVTAAANVDLANRQAEQKDQRYKDLDSMLKTPIVQQGISTQNKVLRDTARTTAENFFYNKWGHTAETQQIFESWWANAEKENAGDVAATHNAQIVAAAEPAANVRFVSPTKGVKTQVAQSGDLAYGGIDQGPIAQAGLGTSEAKKMADQVVSNTRDLLASDTMVVGDVTMFKNIVAADTVKGMDADQIRTHLMSLRTHDNLPLYADATTAKAELVKQMGGGTTTAVSSPQALVEVQKNVSDQGIAIDGIIGAIGAGQKTDMAGVDIKTSIAKVKQDAIDTRNEITRIIEEMRNPATAGIYFDKSDEIISKLKHQADVLDEKSDDLRQMLDKHPELVLQSQFENSVEIGGNSYSIDHDLTSVDPVQAASMEGRVRGMMKPAAQGGSPKYGTAGTAKGATIEPDFPDMLNQDKDVQRIAALAEAQVRRIQALTNQVKTKSFGNDYQRGQVGMPGQPLDLPAVGKIVEAIVRANDTGWSNDKRGLVQDNLVKFILAEQKAGLLNP